LAQVFIFDPSVRLVDIFTSYCTSTAAKMFAGCSGATPNGDADLVEQKVALTAEQQADQKEKEEGISTEKAKQLLETAVEKAKELVEKTKKSAGAGGTSEDEQNDIVFKLCLCLVQCTNAGVDKQQGAQELMERGKTLKTQLMAVKWTKEEKDIKVGMENQPLQTLLNWALEVANGEIKHPDLTNALNEDDPKAALVKFALPKHVDVKKQEWEYKIEESKKICIR